MPPAEASSSKPAAAQASTSASSTIKTAPPPAPPAAPSKDAGAAVPKPLPPFKDPSVFSQEVADQLKLTERAFVGPPAKGGCAGSEKDDSGTCGKPAHVGLLNASPAAEMSAKTVAIKLLDVVKPNAWDKFCGKHYRGIAPVAENVKYEGKQVFAQQRADKSWVYGTQASMDKALPYTALKQFSPAEVACCGTKMAREPLDSVYAMRTEKGVRCFQNANSHARTSPDGRRDWYNSRPVGKGKIYHLGDIKQLDSYTFTAEDDDGGDPPAVRASAPPCPAPRAPGGPERGRQDGDGEEAGAEAGGEAAWGAAGEDGRGAALAFGAGAEGAFAAAGPEQLL